ncbi:deoxyhypusine synthase-like protein [Chytriomyces cf. hyalinus JEL632]|nr:deoxyhypusine synthase-like protein [Chytriomyces cf. hyalinus JEL632]
MDLLQQDQKKLGNNLDTVSIAVEAVMKPSVEMPASAVSVKGYDFNNGINHGAVIRSMITTGFQATSVGEAICEINRMINWRIEDDPSVPADDSLPDPDNPNAPPPPPPKCKIFFGYTSNMISSGLRESIRYLVEHKQVDVIVTSAGGVEEDFIKCLGSTFLASFNVPGKELRDKGLNRIGNLVVPNANYCAFEDWVMPILDEMLDEQKTKGTSWTPSKMIHRLGQKINDPSSVAYWAYKNDIPIYCPAITDGSLGDMIYFHSFRNPGLIIDIAADIRSINNHAVYAKKTGMVILGGGVIKHHICNANLMRNGADFSVYINTGQEFDGSDAGARPDEAVSWGKIKIEAKPVKVYADATIVFPLIVAETFAAKVEKLKAEQSK